MLKTAKTQVLNGDHDVFGDGGGHPAAAISGRHRCQAHGRPTCTWVVRVDGEWTAVGTMPSVVPAK